jgi:hypothetical protein
MFITQMGQSDFGFNLQLLRKITTQQKKINGLVPLPRKPCNSIDSTSKNRGREKS